MSVMGAGYSGTAGSASCTRRSRTGTALPSATKTEYLDEDAQSEEPMFDATAKYEVSKKGVSKQPPIFSTRMQ